MFLHEQKKQRRVWPWVIAIFLALVGIGAIGIYTAMQTITPEQFINSGAVKKYAGAQNNEVLTLVPQLLGFTEPRTYIVVFQNNTEMRPSGGFIGAYATVHFNKGQMNMLAVEGSEELDRRTPKEWSPAPPQPITDYLGVPKWFFRDSNWSPDFGESAKKIREFYAAEGGVAAADVDGVIAITPTVLESMLRMIGPITIQNITFTAENVTETLEYEVEYGYRDRNIAFETRKQILKPFMEELAHRIKSRAFFDFQDFIAEVRTLADQKHILLALDTPEAQKEIEKFHWAGEVLPFDGDYLLWVDANMAALKTDHAMARTLDYAILKKENGDYHAVATMTYTNNGLFDWRTSRYRTYARVYVPEGSELISVEGSMEKDKSTHPGRIDKGRELGKEWFGTFISIEPKQTKTLQFTYRLPESVKKKIMNGDYQLLIQKQPGTIAHGLTLRLNFGTSITGANPPEDQLYWGDGEYRIDTDLRIDRRFGAELR